MKYKNNLRHLREQHGDIPQEKIAEAAGIARTTYINYEKGGREIPGNVLAKLAEFFDTTTDYILGVSNRECSVSLGFGNVMLYGSVAGGVPIEIIEDCEMKEAPARFLDDDPDCFLVRVRGDSESRRGICDGDFALISPRRREPTAHDLFLVAVNGDDATIKQVRKLHNGVELIPDSHDPTFQPQVFDFNVPGTPKIEVIGQVVWHCAAF